MEVERPFSGCSEVRAMLRKERSGRESWLLETDTENNLSHAQAPQEGPGGQDCLHFCGWASVVEVALLK